MNTNIFDHLEQFQTLIREAHSVLDFVRAHPPPELDMNSPARLAFDPYIARRLVTFMPIRVLDLPPIDKTWNALEQLLHGWTEMAHLSISRSLLTWEVRVLCYGSSPFLNHVQDKRQPPHLATSRSFWLYSLPHSGLLSRRTARIG